MGNIGSSGANSSGSSGSRQQEIASNRQVHGPATTPYPSHYPNPPSYYQYPGYCPPPSAVMPFPFSAPFDHYHRPPPPPHMGPVNWMEMGMGGPVLRPLAPYMEHQKAITKRNDVNVKKETLRLEPDEENPGHYLVSFKFDAAVTGRITVIFFAKEGDNYQLIPTKESLPAPVAVDFQQGLDQKFRQSLGTGIDFSMFEEAELLKVGDMDLYPLTVKAEASPGDESESTNRDPGSGPTNSQITLAVFEKEKSEYHVRVVKQILWVSGMRYELQEIYGIGNSVEADFDGNDSGKECVICLAEPRDTTLFPCRHMCMCSGCAKVLRLQTNRCPICRQPIERLLEIKVTNAADD